MRQVVQIIDVEALKKALDGVTVFHFPYLPTNSIFVSPEVFHRLHTSGSIQERPEEADEKEK